MVSETKGHCYFARPCIRHWPAADCQILYPADSPNAARQLPEHAAADWHQMHLG